MGCCNRCDKLHICLCGVWQHNDDYHTGWPFDLDKKISGTFRYFRHPGGVPFLFAGLVTCFYFSGVGFSARLPWDNPCHGITG